MFCSKLFRKGETFVNELFSKECIPITNSSVLPTFNLLTDKIIDSICMHDDEIITLIRNLNPNKASGSDGISAQLLLLCDRSVILPVKITCQNILEASTYPGMWKLANVTPVFKKGNKQLVKIYMPITHYLKQHFQLS